jgi:uncharacterized membrane protein (UPF0127 family)
MGIIAENWTIDDRVQLTVQRATGLARLTGLLRRPLPKHRQALCIPRCRSVHTFGMHAAIDVVFIDREQRVSRTTTVKPRRVATCRTANSVIELRAGEAQRLGIRPGSKFTRQHASNRGTDAD